MKLINSETNQHLKGRRDKNSNSNDNLKIPTGMITSEVAISKARTILNNQ